MLLLLMATTAVGVLRARDHQSRLRSLEATSLSAAALEHARGEFLNGTNSLTGLAFIPDPRYFFIYQTSRQLAQQDLSQAQVIALSEGRQADAAFLDDLIARIDAFDEGISDRASLFLAGDEEAATEGMAEMAVTAEEIIDDLDLAANRERSTVATQRVAADQASSVTLWLQVGLGGFALMIASIVAIVLVASVIRPLASLRASARAITAGDLEARAKVSGPEEVTSLAQDFNHMTATLLGRTRELEQRHHQLSLVSGALSALSQEPTTEGVLRLGRKLVLEHAGARRLIVWRMENGQPLIWRGSRDTDRAEAGIESASAGAASARLAARRGTPLRVFAEADGDGASSALPNGEAALGTNTLYVPLGRDGSTQAVFEIEWAHAAHPAEADVQLLETLGIEIGMALERARLYEESREQANRDFVTGVLSHRAIQADLEASLAARNDRGRPLALVAMDVDNFKLFNDTYGHALGDRVLRTIADHLAVTCQGRGSVGRLGGDEFMVILPDAHSEEAFSFAQGFQVWLSEQDFRIRGGERIPIAVSCGVAICPEDGKKRDELLATADANLYESKLRGGKIVSHYRAQGERVELRKKGAFGLLESLITSIDNKDHYTKAHCESMAEYAVMLGQELEHSEQVLKTLRIAGLLHDVGKICIPDRILRKPGPLTDAEYEIVKHHVVMAESLLVDLPNIEEIRTAALHHHERFDGTGYIRGLKGEEIPLLGRILGVADAFSAMILDRPYRKALPVSQALDELRRVAGTQLDPDLVEAFVRAVEREKRTEDLEAKAGSKT
jgi:diguanylate cyclase (GGDEF)-like protein